MHKKLATISGIVFIFIGVLGFFANPIIGSVGFLRTGILDNLAHIVIGLVLFALPKYAKNLLRGIGIFLITFAVIGFIAGGDFEFFGGLMRMNMALDVTGLIVGLLLFGLSYLRE